MNCPFEGDCSTPCQGSDGSKDSFGVCSPEQPGVRCGSLLASRILLSHQELVAQTDEAYPIVAVSDSLVITMPELDLYGETLLAPFPWRQKPAGDDEESRLTACSDDVTITMLLAGHVQKAVDYSELVMSDRAPLARQIDPSTVYRFIAGGNPTTFEFYSQFAGPDFRIAERLN